MTLTKEQEEILKLVADEIKARKKLDIVNQTMGDAIRAEFKVIDDRIRAETKPIYEPLQIKYKEAQDNLKKYFE